MEAGVKPDPTDEFCPPRRSNKNQMPRTETNPVVHLELHTGDLAGARSFYAELFGWRAEPFDAGHRSYLALELGRALGGGMVECPTPRSLWLPYVEVDEIGRATDHARVLGASVLLEPREGPAGWRSVVATASGGEIALWQSKR
jgi:predicted enzyme related to lactoylglutathione lyase